jgi:hypothetical protein
MSNPFCPTSRVLLATALLGASLLLSSGCARDPRDKLNGKWIGERIDNVDPDQIARATGWVKGTSFEFSGDKLTVTLPTEAPRSGTYKVAKLEGEKMLLAVTRSDSATVDQATLTSVDPKTLRWDIGQGREIVLVKAQ